MVIGQAKTFSTVTSSRTFARAKALLKTISVFIWDLLTSPDRHLRIQHVPECSNTSNNASVSTMKTRYKTLPQINWDYCIVCRQKAIKKDSKLKRIESS
jgi:hypothetical protein